LAWAAEGFLRAARDQLQQQLMDLRHLAGVFLAEGSASVDQDP
jgi:hypothetical protein